MHYSLLVFGQNVEEQMKPYGENMTVSPYKVYVDESDVRGARKYLTKERVTFSYSFPYAERVRNVIPPRFTEESFDSSTDWIEAWFGYPGGSDENGFYYISTINPMSKWDYYIVGGRFGEPFIRTIESVIRDITEGDGFQIRANPKKFDSSVLTITMKTVTDSDGATADRLAHIRRIHRDTPALFSTASAVKGDIDWALMWSVGNIRASLSWDYHMLQGETSDKSDDAVRLMIGSFPDETREEFINRTSLWVPSSYLKDGEWVEGPRYTNDRKESEMWSRTVYNLIYASPDNTLLTAIDYHI